MKLAELKAPYTFTMSMVKQLWQELNKACFESKLHEPPIYLESSLNHLVSGQYLDKHENGDVLGFCDEDPETHELVLLLSTKIESPHELMQVLAHEMVHQALAEKLGYVQMLKVGHGPAFMAYAPAIKRYHNLVLFGASF
jgi:hypothetical protein